MAVGVFDLLHPGHLHYLEEARRLGDELVVVVSTDAQARRRKRTLVLPEAVRLRLVRALKPVDEAVLGDPEDQLRSVERLRPDVIALGYDDYHDVEELRKRLAERGLRPELVRVSKLEQGIDGTRKIVQRVLELHGPGSGGGGAGAP